MKASEALPRAGVIYRTTTPESAGNCVKSSGRKAISCWPSVPCSPGSSPLV